MLPQIDRRHRRAGRKEGQMRPVSTVRQLPFNLEDDFASHSIGDDPAMLHDAFGFIDPDQHYTTQGLSSLATATRRASSKLISDCAVTSTLRTIAMEASSLLLQSIRSTMAYARIATSQSDRSR